MLILIIKVIIKEVFIINYEYSLAITSQYYFCGIPFRLDTTPKCPLNCLYCFAMARGGRRTNINQIANLKNIESQLIKSENSDVKKLSLNEEILRNKVPVHFGGMSDPFSNELTTKISKSILQLLSKHNYPVVISTKNTNFLMQQDTIDILKNIKNLIIQISFTTSNDKFSKLIEPNAPLPSDRLNCIKTLTDEGIYVMARLQPIIPIFIDNIIEELIPSFGSSGVKHVILEFLKIPVEKNISLFKDMYNVLNWNAYDYYKKNNAILVGREWILPNYYMWETLEPIIDSIHKNNMTFGAGDYGLNHLSDTNCCCGIDKHNGFSNWYKGNFPYLIKTAKESYISFDSFNKIWLPSNSIKRYINSKCRLQNKNQIRDYLKNKWNHPGTCNAPDTFLGVSWSGEYDNEGNCIYIINDKYNNR